MAGTGRASVERVWDRTTESLGERGGAIAVVALLGLALPTVVSAVIAPTPGSSVAHGFAAAAFNLAANILSVFASLAIAAIVLVPGATGDALRLAGRRLLPAIGAYLLVALVIALLFVPVVLVGMMSGAAMPAAATGAGGMVTMIGRSPALGIAVLVWLVVVLVLAVRIAPLSGVVLMERLGARAPFRAWRLTAGMTLRLVGVLLLYIVVTSIAVSATSFVVGAIAGVLMGGGEGAIGLSPAATLVTAAASAAVSAGFTALLSVFSAQLYAVTAAAAPVPGHGPVGEAGEPA